MKRIINTHTLFFIEYNVSVLQNNQLEQFNFFVIVTIYLESWFSNLLSFHPLPSSAQNGGEENREALIRSIRGDSNANSSVFFPNVFVSRTTTYIESSRPLPSPDICQIFIESSLLSPRTYKHSYIYNICRTCYENMQYMYIYIHAYTIFGGSRLFPGWAAKYRADKRPRSCSYTRARERKNTPRDNCATR